MYVYLKAHAPLPPALRCGSGGDASPLQDWFLQFCGGELWGSRERLGASWGLLGDLEVVLGSHVTVLGRRWGRFEALLGLLGPILGPSWALLGAC